LLGAAIAVPAGWSGVAAPVPDVSQVAPVEVYFRADFDAGNSAFAPVGSASVSLADAAADALSGRSLSVAQASAGGVFGAMLEGLRIGESRGLRLAFTVRTRGMRTVAVNLFDEARRDNSTPASPVRTIDDEWRAAVLHVEDFHYNADPPDRKVAGGERFGSLLFHGSQEGETARIWIDKLVVYRGPDRTPPAAPSGLTAESGTSGIELRWSEASDDTFASVYSIYRQPDGGEWVKVGESLRLAYRDVVPAPGSYRYRVTAADYENNLSPPSAETLVTAAAGGPAPPAAPDVVQDRRQYAAHVREVHARGRGVVRPGVFLFAGDSITGAMVYTHRVGSWLARGQTVRQGVASVTTSYGAQNIGAYLRDAQPEFAVVMYGTNDDKGGRDVEAAMRSLAAIVDASIERGTVPILATIPPRGFSKSQGDQQRFNKAVVGLARQKRVPVSYVFEEMMQRDLREMLSDGIHLSPEEGNDAAGRALRRTMDQVYFALRDR
jgi:hypothetical protein